MLLSLLIATAWASTEGDQRPALNGDIFVSVRLDEGRECQFWTTADVGLTSQKLLIYLKSVDEGSKLETRIQFLMGDGVPDECLTAGTLAAIGAGFKKVSQPSR